MSLKNMRRHLAKFFKKFPEIGKNVLSAYNKVDPFGCYYGENKNPDKYISYAHNFCQLFKSAKTLLGDNRLKIKDSVSSFDIIKELVRRSFPPMMIVNGEIGECRIEKIAQLIISFGINFDCYLVDR